MEKILNGRPVEFNEESKEWVDAETKEVVPTEKELEVAKAEGYDSRAVANLGLTNDLAAFKMAEGEAWGAGADIAENKELFVNDYLIPKLWLIQSMSQLRLDGLANEGDYCNSINGKKLSNGEDPISFVVVNTFKRWQTFKINEKGKKEFVESETMTLQNANYNYEFTRDGMPHTRRQVLSYTVLLGKDLENGVKRPYVLDFAGSSKRAGRVLITEINEVRDAGYPSAVLLFNITSKSEKNDDGQFFVKEVQKIGVTNPEVVTKAREVYEDLKINADQVVVDESDLLNKAKTPQVLDAPNDEV